MMTLQNLDILRLELAFRLEKNCQCIPGYNTDTLTSFSEKDNVSVFKFKVESLAKFHTSHVIRISRHMLTTLLKGLTSL